MSVKTYHGSCECNRVRYEVNLDLSKGTFKCNCSICTKGRFWGATVSPKDFKLLAGESDLSEYSPGHIQHRFCKHCGIKVFGSGDQPGAGGKFIAISLGTLDDLNPRDWASAPVSYPDGRSDRWDKEAEFKAHL
jgi:hypothetical protein